MERKGSLYILKNCVRFYWKHFSIKKSMLMLGDIVRYIFINFTSHFFAAIVTFIILKLVLINFNIAGTPIASSRHPKERRSKSTCSRQKESVKLPTSRVIDKKEADKRQLYVLSYDGLIPVKVLESSSTTENFTQDGENEISEQKCIPSANDNTSSALGIIETENRQIQTEVCLSDTDMTNTNSEVYYTTGVGPKVQWEKMKCSVNVIKSEDQVRYNGCNTTKDIRSISSGTWAIAADLVSIMASNDKKVSKFAQTEPKVWYEKGSQICAFETNKNFGVLNGTSNMTIRSPNTFFTTEGSPGVLPKDCDREPCNDEEFVDDLIRKSETSSNKPASKEQMVYDNIRPVYKYDNKKNSNNSDRPCSCSNCTDASEYRNRTCSDDSRGTGRSSFLPQVKGRVYIDIQQGNFLSSISKCWKNMFSTGDCKVEKKKPANVTINLWKRNLHSLPPSNEPSSTNNKTDSYENYSPAPYNGNKKAVDDSADKPKAPNVQIIDSSTEIIPTNSDTTVEPPPDLPPFRDSRGSVLQYVHPEGVKGISGHPKKLERNEQEEEIIKGILEDLRKDNANLESEKCDEEEVRFTIDNDNKLREKTLTRNDRGETFKPPKFLKLEQVARSRAMEDTNPVEIRQLAPLKKKSRNSKLNNNSSLQRNFFSYIKTKKERPLKLSQDNLRSKKNSTSSNSSRRSSTTNSSVSSLVVSTPRNHSVSERSNLTNTLSILSDISVISADSSLSVSSTMEYGVVKKIKYNDRKAPGDKKCVRFSPVVDVNLRSADSFNVTKFAYKKKKRKLKEVPSKKLLRLKKNQPKISARRDFMPYQFEQRSALLLESLDYDKRNRSVIQDAEIYYPSILKPYKDDKRARFVKRLSSYINKVHNEKVGLQNVEIDGVGEGPSSVR